MAWGTLKKQKNPNISIIETGGRDFLYFTKLITTSRGQKTCPLHISTLIAKIGILVAELHGIFVEDISSTIRTRKMRRITRSFLCRTLNGNPPSYARLCRVGGRSMTFKSETRPDTHFVDRFTVSNGALS